MGSRPLRWAARGLGCCVALLCGCDTDGSGLDSGSDAGSSFSATHHGVAAWVSGAQGTLALALDDEPAGLVASDKGPDQELSGTASAGVLSLGSGELSLEGTIAGDTVRGDLSGAAGAGVFVALRGDRDDVRLYCGLFSGDLTGVVSLAIGADDTVAAAIASRDGAWLATPGGQLAGKSLLLSVDSGEVSGLCSASACSGSWSRDGQIGTWESTRDDCPELP